MSDIKTIGVLTSGADCAGLNAVIRAVTYRAIQGYGWKVLGVLDGTAGLLDRTPRYRELRIVSKLCENAPIGMVGVPKTIGARTLDPNDALVHTARGLGIHLGEQRMKKRE